MPYLSPDFEAWSHGAGGAVARRDVAAAVRAALDARGSLHLWASEQPGRTTFSGRGEAYGVALGERPAVVRHSRRGGYVIAPLLGDRFFGAPRLFLELEWSRRLADAGVATPAFLAGAWRRSGLLHRADVATERIAGTDLASLMFSDSPPLGEDRAAVMAAVARLVRRMHDAGIVHPDLQLKNVLVGGGPVAHLLDVDTCRLAGSAESTRRNLRRFHRSWGKWNRRRGARLTEADWDAFQAAYSTGGAAG